MVALNRAVAVAEVQGPAAGAGRRSTALDLDHYHLFHATRGDLLQRLGRTDEAATALAHAVDLVSNEAQRTFLIRRLADVGPTPDD